MQYHWENINFTSVLLWFIRLILHSGALKPLVFVKNGFYLLQILKCCGVSLVQPISSQPLKPYPFCMLQQKKPNFYLTVRRQHCVRVLTIYWYCEHVISWGCNTNFQEIYCIELLQQKKFSLILKCHINAFDKQRVCSVAH